MPIDIIIQDSLPGANELNGNIVSASFTPPANSLLIVAPAVIDVDAHQSGGFTVTDSESGTWTSRAPLVQEGSTFDIHFEALSSPIGGSPVSMQVTIDPLWSPPSHGDGYVILTVTGHDIAAPFPQAGVSNSQLEGGGDSEAVTTATLGSAPTLGSLVLIIVAANNEVSGVYSGFPSGFTAEHNLSGVECHTLVLSNVATTGTSFTISDLGQSVESSATALLEIKAAPAAVVKVPAGILIAQEDQTPKIRRESGAFV